MDKKSKIAIPILDILAFGVIVVILFGFQKNNSTVVFYPNTKTETVKNNQETKINTGSAVIGEVKLINQLIIF